MKQEVISTSRHGYAIPVYLVEAFFGLFYMLDPEKAKGLAALLGERGVTVWGAVLAASAVVAVYAAWNGPRDIDPTGTRQAEMRGNVGLALVFTVFIVANWEYYGMVAIASIMLATALTSAAIWRFFQITTELRRLAARTTHRTADADVAEPHDQ